MEKKRGPGRPPNPFKKEDLTLKVPKGTMEYLNQAAATHLCGGQSPTEAAMFLIYEGLNRLIEQGKIGPGKRFEHYLVESEDDSDES